MKFIWSYCIGFSLLCCLFFSCENEESLIGENFLITGEHEVFILHPDSINISAFSQFEDSVNAQNSTNLAGSYIDPIFGQAEASFYFEITLPNNELSFNATAVTSARIQLPYTGFYGDSTSQFNIYLSELQESISANDSSQYFSNQTYATVPITPTSGSETWLGTISLNEIQDSSALHIELPTDFVLFEILQLEETELINTETFIQAFNGFKLEATPLNSMSGAIMYFNTSDENALLNVEYLDGDGASQSINFPISTGNALNHFNHDYNDTPIETIDSLLYLQSMAGTFAELNFDFLKNLQDSGYIVNQAELSFSIFDNNQSFQIPEQIALVEFDNGNILSIAGLSGGALNTENNTYEFNITQHIQKILTQNHNTICRLYTSSRTSNAERVILNNTTSNPIQLKLTLIKG
ncbi:MAG: hypothetical protein CMD23_03010 [Flavobacteriales bacterium]|nr:hypothetical protein [Flavobacteriales bacterium]|tara:strand:+ start:1016 stop:2245 length:1230 start_codon:yes stop_codon:yes gene_type:complete